MFSLRDNKFSGRIPQSLFNNNNNNNSKLQILSISNNSLNGNIPEEIGNCSSLQNVYLDNNHLTGPIPYGIFNLSSLREINIKYNGLSGTLPSDICNNLPNLTTLTIEGNQIEGQIPNNIGKCRELEILSLSRNNFNGEIPREIGSMNKLRQLFLGYNDLQGGVPAELGNLRRLEILHITQASLAGPIPKEIGNCTFLKILVLSVNNISGQLPQELANLAYLEFLSVYNNSLSGSLPSSIFNISTLKTLQLSFNQFSGSLPSQISLPSLQNILVDGTKLSGRIPSSINNSSKLVLLQLTENSFTGSVPNFGNLRFLRQLIIWKNHLSGAESPNQELDFIASLTNCRFLEDLLISENPLNGILPISIGNLSTSLKNFYAIDCNITSVIPSTIGNLINLIVFYLNRNQLTGFIPPTIGELKKLQGLSLSTNRLQGYIPREICRLSNMVELDLSVNILTGLMPDCLGDVQSLRTINLGSNKLNSTIPSHSWNLKDLLGINLSSNYFSGQFSSLVANLRVINTLDLSLNHLSGGIPESIGSCQSLEFLYLSNNQFKGSIPPSLGTIRGLTLLDLSNNNLSSSIPKPFETLQFLKYFNVSYNKLEGEIPTGGHFTNFTAHSFLNNPALCGDSKFHVPPCIDKDELKRSNKVGRLMYILCPFILVIILSTIIVLVLVWRRKLKSVPTQLDISLGFTWRRISYLELVRGTNEFSETNLLGKGSFGSVFKATLSCGLIVAVKVFNLQFERVVRSFETECEILRNVRHRNLVQVIGCCTNTEFKSMILEYMPNGSLEKWLHSENYCLDLVQRLRISIDVASALEYLHHGHTFPVVHCDIKPSNVLLDEDMVARISDFGISKLFRYGETMVQTKTLATIGYAAPEYGSEGKVSTNGDVYSYGILLLEIFTKKKPTDNMFCEEMSLSRWVNEALHENGVSEVVASDLLANEEDQHFRAKVEECVSSIFRLAMKCLAVSPDERINMIETVATLHRIKANIISNTARRQQYALSITVGH